MITGDTTMGARIRRLDLEYTALRLLQTFEERIKEVDTELWLVGLNRDVEIVARRSGLWETPAGRLFHDVPSAVDAYVSHTHPESAGETEGG